MCYDESNVVSRRSKTSSIYHGRAGGGDEVTISVSARNDVLSAGGAIRVESEEGEPDNPVLQMCVAQADTLFLNKHAQIKTLRNSYCAERC